MTGSHASQLFGNRVVVDWGRGRIRAFTANRRSFGRTYSAFPRVLEGAVPSKLMVSCRLAIPIAFFRYAVPRSQIGWRCLRPWLWRGRGSVLSALKCIRDSVQRTCSKNLNLTKPPSTPVFQRRRRRPTAQPREKRHCGVGQPHGVAARHSLKVKLAYASASLPEVSQRFDPPLGFETATMPRRGELPASLSCRFGH